MNNAFDYVIVGGGSAGCVLANRLSADPAVSVLLLEAGPDDTNPFIHIPGGIIPVIRSNTLNWKFETEPETACGQRRMFWPRGRTLGGSSAINAMCYIRGHRDDFDHWASLGCTGWAYDDVLPLFKAMEHFEPGADAFHGEGGPLNVAEPRYVNPIMKAFIEAATQAGHRRNDDFNGAEQEGVGLYHVMQKDGQRCSNARAFLSPVRDRVNLSVVTDAHARRVVFEGRRAVGVEYSRKGRIDTARARHEVILSAGAIGSPQLLLLSGIGPKAELDRHGIPVVQELPGVGENLQDHLDIHVTVTEKTRHAITLHPSGLWRSLKMLWSYLRSRSGELTSNFAQAGGFLKSDPSQPIPDLQWHIVPFVYANHGQKLWPLVRHRAFTLMTCFLRPESRGRIRLASADPLAKPRIEANYLATERDLDALVTGLRKAREVLAQPAMAPHYRTELEPGADVQSDAALRDFIRQRAETVYHPVGTCRMGVDDMAVVDPRLQVRGVQGLRVVDASIMPTLVGGNTNAGTTMIGENAARMILEDRVAPSAKLQQAA
jgi:choline dehydrogenase